MAVSFVYITDTHLGARQGVGYHQQPRYAEHLMELLGHLDAWIATQRPNVAFILHGGDMVDSCTPETLGAARAAFSLRVPVYLSLGNHDLTAPDALDSWLSQAPDFFPEGRPAYALAGDDWMVHIVPTQWCARPYLWQQTQHPHLLADDVAALVASLRQHPDKSHLICTHGEALAVPAEQVGRTAPYHPPLASFSATLEELALTQPQLGGILGGHSHINTVGRLGGAYAVTGSAFTETPFEFKVIEIGAEVFSMETQTLLPAISFRADYDWDRTFVQGRRCDRSFGA